jgi:response regulator RpfG family c-di-GMP phosphodiesterase
MPGMSGLAVCEALQQDRRWMRPIVAVSANAFESDEDQAAASGCDGFVTKPVHLQDLLEQLQLHLSLEWVRDAVIAPVNPEGDANRRRAIPPVANLLVLREYARIGYIQGLTEELNRIGALDADYLPHVSRLREYVREFRTTEIVAFIEENLDHERTAAT